MKYDPKNYPIHKSCPIQRIIYPGEFIFVACPSRGSVFFVRAIVNEVCYVHATETGSSSLWPSLFLDGYKYAQENPTEVLEKLEGTKIFNQFPWTDWPLGHAAYIGSDGFFTLEEARKAYGRGRKKYKYRAAKKHLRNFKSLYRKVYV